MVYNEIFHGVAIHQMDSFFIWVCSLLKIRKGERLLDVATGRGQMLQFASEYGAESYGLDFSSTACKIASETPAKGVLCANGQKVPFPDNFFDMATNLGSLEHFDTMEEGVREMARVLKPGGRACIVVPNTFGLRWNVQVAWKTGDVSDDGQPLQRYGTRKQWTDLLERNGLMVTRVLGYEHERAFPRTKHDFLGYLKSPKRLISMIAIVPFIPVNAAGQFVFICQNNKDQKP